MKPKQTGKPVQRNPNKPEGRSREVERPGPQKSKIPLFTESYVKVTCKVTNNPMTWYKYIRKSYKIKHEKY